MKRYLTLLFLVLFISIFGFSGFVFAEQVNNVSISKVSAIQSNPGYINYLGRENIMVEGLAPAGSTVVVTLSDSANPTNKITETQTVSADSTYRIGFNGKLALPEPFHDGLIKVSASVGSLLTTTTLIQETVAPTITIIGDDPFYCRVHNGCPDLGAVALDSFGNKLSVTALSNVRENTVGYYNINYNTVDLAGNTATALRRVNISTRSSGLSNTTIIATTTLEQIPVPIPTVVPAVSSTPILVENVVINQATSTQGIVVTPSTPVVGVVVKVSGIKNLIKRQLKSGISGTDVKLLQTLLAQDTSVYPEGLVTGYYGNLTKKAIQAFQEKNNIVSKGKAGYGEVGPKTKLKLIEVYGE